MIHKHDTKLISAVGFLNITPTPKSKYTFQNLHTSDQMLVSHDAALPALLLLSL